MTEKYSVDCHFSVVKAVSKYMNLYELWGWHLILLWIHTIPRKTGVGLQLQQHSTAIATAWEERKRQSQH